MGHQKKLQVNIGKTTSKRNESSSEKKNTLGATHFRAFCQDKNFLKRRFWRYRKRQTLELFPSKILKNWDFVNFYNNIASKPDLDRAVTVRKCIPGHCSSPRHTYTGPFPTKIHKHINNYSLQHSTALPPSVFFFFFRINLYGYNISFALG